MSSPAPAGGPEGTGEFSGVRPIPGFRRGVRGALEFVREVYEQAAADNVFFLASGLTFYLLLAAIPFLVVLLSIAGVFLAYQFEAPRSAVIDWLWTVLPATESVQAEFRAQVAELVEVSRSVGLIGVVLFVWFSTRLFGGLRTVLQAVFDLREGPGILRSKLLDMRLVVVTTLLLTANFAISAWILGVGREVLRLLHVQAGLPLQLLGYATAFGVVWLMFFIIYAFVPSSRVRLRVAGVAATFSAVAFELLKFALSWYLTDVADFSRVFFAFATLVVLVISLYYASIIFILGGEVAKVWTLRRAMRRQREAFET